MTCLGSPQGRAGIRPQACLTPRPSTPSHCHKGPAPVRPVQSLPLPSSSPRALKHQPRMFQKGRVCTVPVPLRVCESISGVLGICSSGKRVYTCPSWCLPLLVQSPCVHSHSQATCRWVCLYLCFSPTLQITVLPACNPSPLHPRAPSAPF